MKTAAISASFAVAALLLTSCDHEAVHNHLARGGDSVTINRTFPAAQIRALDVSEVNGAISVEAANVQEITLVATARGDLDLREGDPNRGLFETTIDGDTLRIERKDRKRGFNVLFFFGRDMRIDYALRVPARVALDISTVNGRITTRGIDGETQAATVNGRMELETTGRHALQATTVNGRVQAKFLESFQGARFKTVNGRVLAILPQSASFNVDLSQVNGDFEASFPLSIHSNPGRRHVSGAVNGGRHELKIVTVNGDVELARLNEPR